MKIVSNGKFYEKTPEKPKNIKIKNSGIEPHLHLLQQYSNFDWDRLDINDLYYEFKDIEKQLKTMLEVGLLLFSYIKRFLD